MEEKGLSGGAKFGYLALGFFLALIGVLITYLVNRDKAPEIKSQAMKFSIIGCVIVVALGIISTIASMALIGSMVATTGYYGY